MKIKNLTIVALILSFLVILTSIYVNFDLVLNVRFYVDKNNELVEKINEDRLKLEIPIQKLKDINEYSRTSVSIAIIKDNVMDIIDSMQSTSLELKNNLSTMNDISIKRHNASVQKISSKLLQLQINLDQVKFVMNQNMLLNDMLDTSDNNRRIISELINEIKLDYDELNSVILSDLTIVLNTMFILLMIVIVSLFFGLIRFVYFQIPYIVKGLNMRSEEHTSELKSPGSST